MIILYVYHNTIYLLYAFRDFFYIIYHYIIDYWLVIFVYALQERIACRADLCPRWLQRTWAPVGSPKCGKVKKGAWRTCFRFYKCAGLEIRIVSVLLNVYRSDFGRLQEKIKKHCKCRTNTNFICIFICFDLYSSLLCIIP